MSFALAVRRTPTDAASMPVEGAPTTHLLAPAPGCWEAAGADARCAACTQALLGVADELKMTLNAIKVLASRYLRKDADGKVSESTSQIFRRVAHAIASVDKDYPDYAQGVDALLLLVDGVFDFAIEAGDVAYTHGGHELIAALHFGDTPTQRVGRFLHVGDDRCEQMRDALVDR